MEMRKHGMINNWLVLAAVAVSWVAVQTGSGAAVENGVGVGMDNVGWGSDRTCRNGVWEESALKLKFSIVLSVSELRCFGQYADTGLQYLDVTDSSGRKLAPAEIRLSAPIQNAVDGMVYLRISGTAGEAPGPDASWLRLKGTLRVPLARLVKGDVYELPAEKGTEVYIDVPGSNGGEGEASEDVVTARTASSSRIVLKEYKKIEYEGKKMVKAEIGLEADAPIELSAFQILNDKNEVRETMTGGMSYSPVESSCRADATYFFKDPGDGKKLRIRPVYRAFRKLVKIPVDIKFGMRGEIRDEPGKKK